MKNCITQPLSSVSANVCIVPKWLLDRLDAVGEPLSILTDSKASGNILSDEEIIYYLNGMHAIFTLPELFRLWSEGLDVLYVTKHDVFRDGVPTPVAPNVVMELLATSAEVQKAKLLSKYRTDYPTRFEHIVIGHYLRGPDSDVDLTSAWYVSYDVKATCGNIYVSYEVKAGNRLPQAERDYRKKLLTALSPYADRNALRASSLYASLISNT